MRTFTFKCVRNSHETKDEKVISIDLIEKVKVFEGDCLNVNGYQLLIFFDILGYDCLIYFES